MQYIDYAKNMNANDEVLNWVKLALSAELKKREITTTEIEHIIDRIY